MSVKKSADILKSTAKFDQVDNIATVKFSCDIYKNITEFDRRDELSAIFKSIAQQDKYEALLFLNEPGCLGETDYFAFLDTIIGHDTSYTNSVRAIGYSERIVRSRELNILDQFILDIVGFNKLTVSCLNGEIVTPFFGASLASDFRFASDDMCFSLAHTKYNLHPSGGLPFFLQNYVGQGKATELLLTGGKITAKEALELGLITHIFSKEHFDNQCIMKAKELCKIGKQVVKRTKRLTNVYADALKEYFDLEAKYV